MIFVGITFLAAMLDVLADWLDPCS
jgi:hypothetical protein